MIQKLQYIIEAKDTSSLIDFLKNLSDKERSYIARKIEDSSKEHIDRSNMEMDIFLEHHEIQEYYQSDLYQKYAIKHTKFQLVQFICGTVTYVNSDICKLIYQHQILDWYFPRWLYEDKHDRYFPTHYYLQLKCQENNVRTASWEETANALARFDLFSVETIPQITLQEHIWYLFAYECNIHNQYEGKGDYWIEMVVKLAQEKKISHLRVVEECLLSVTRFSNKAITGYFFKMLYFLEPTDEELLALQPSLHLVLQSQHSKPINQTLKYIKRIYKEPSFDIDSFMEQVPLLLSWSVKSVVNATLSLIDLLIKAYPAYKESLALLATQALAQTDESLQSKTIKLLAKHKLLEKQTILDEISIYSDGLYSNIKAMLPDMQQIDSKSKDIEITPPKYIREDNRIIYPESFEDMVFFFSSILDATEPYKFDIFTALLPKFDTMVTKNNADKIAPAIQRAYRYYIKWGVSERIEPQLYFIVSNALLYYGWLLIRRLSKNFSDRELSFSLHKLFFNSFKSPRGAEFSKIIQKEYNESPKEYKDFQKLLASLQAFVGYEVPPIDFKNLPKEASVLYIFKQQLQQTFKNIEIQTPPQIPLSLPTHSPCFIEMQHFISRVNNHKEFSDMQMQITLQRLQLENIDEKIFDLLVSSELKLLLLYLSNKVDFPSSPLKHPSWWLIAISRKQDKEALKTFVQTYIKTKINIDAIFNVSFEVISKKWQYEGWEKGEKVMLSMIDKKLKLYKEPFLINLPFESIFKHIYIEYQNSEISILDVIYGLYLMPLTPEPYIVKFLENIIGHWGSSQTKKATEYFVKYLIDIWRDFQPSATTFVAVMMLYESKTARQLSSELWYKATTEGTMNHQLLGEILGKLEHNEYAPLKRFTDLVVSNMLNLSSLHNQALHTLLSSMISQMNDEPIKGTKKLLEIYLEVLSLTNLEIPQKTRTKLQIWGEVKSLRSVVKKINSRR